MYSLVTLLLFTAGVVTALPTSFVCPDDGYYPDPDQCDKYYSCYRGQYEEKLCPDGLVFDTMLSPRIGSCNYPFLAPPCPANSILQAPKPGENCERQNGFFEHQDPSVCDEYYDCSHGNFVLRTCHDGLVFDKNSGTCKWAHSKVRTGCGKKELESLNGFICPQQPQYSINGHRMVHARFLKDDDCRYYYVCLDGKKPTLAGCPEGLVFNDISLQCDDPLFVAGCENYYGRPVYYDIVEEEPEVPTIEETTNRE